MPLIPLSCPMCGANLTVDSDKDAAICEFCGKPYIVKEAIVQNYISNVINIDTVNVNLNRDFVIKAGTLLEYNGEDTVVKIPDNVKTISPYAFAGSSIEEIIVSEGVTEIPAHAFENCSLVKVILSNNVKSIREKAFKGCIALKEIVFSETLSTIETEAFSHCYSLKSLEFPKSIAEINRWAFLDCTGLESVVIPDNQERPVKLERGVFAGAKNLRKVYWADHYLKDIIYYFGLEESQEIENLWQVPHGICPACGGQLAQKRNDIWKCKNCRRMYSYK